MASEIKFPTGERDLVFHYAGIEACTPGLHWKSVGDHYRFQYILSGKGRVRHGYHEYAIAAGNGFLTFPGDLCDYQADIEEPWHYLWCAFYGKAALPLVTSIGLSRDEPVFKSSDAEKTSAELRGIAEALVKSKSYFERMSCLYGLLDTLDRSRGRERPAAGSESAPMDYVEAALSYVRSNYSDKDCSIESMARRLGLSRCYLATFLRKRAGKTPQELLALYRMSKARELLSSTTLPIYEIAEAVGYPDPMSFSRAFRRWSGMTPSECRRMNYAAASLAGD
jgi:AraC-like DNA-binding protein